jgi:hypothetical protein
MYLQIGLGTRYRQTLLTVFQNFKPPLLSLPEPCVEVGSGVWEQPDTVSHGEHKYYDLQHLNPDEILVGINLSIEIISQ